jgi:membrane protease YdiL (CAAX protease family)
MNPFDENPKPLPGENSPQEISEPLDDLAARIVVGPVEPGDPAAPRPSTQPSSGGLVSLVGVTPPPPPSPLSFLPEDLRIGWSWLHLFFFGLFAFGSLAVIQVAVIIYYSSGQHLTQKQMEQLFQTKPGLAVGSNVLWFLLVLLFLYVTLAVLRDRPFWPTLGWRKLDPDGDIPSSPWLYLGGGAALAICVAIASSRLKTPDHLPIQDLFKSRTGAFSLMAMAVLIAPLVEETVFRGYLYPLFASSFSRMAKYLGSQPDQAVQTGTRIAIVLTGSLFGVLHGAQLGWTWGLVAMLVTVGIIFTFARARAGTVFVSFLLHLGYNSFIAFSAIFATHGFTRMPPHP